MKRNSVIISSILFVIVLYSCNKFIDLHPSSFNNSSTFYNDSTGIKEAVFGAYHYLQPIYGTATWFWAMTEMRSDNTTFEYNNADRGALQGEQIDYFEETPDNNYILNVWTTIYQAIVQCNMVLDHIDQVKISDASKNQAIGEVSFLRSLYYFNLVRLFGSIPLVLHAAQSPDQVYSKKASVDQVYNQIISDAKTAASLLPASWPASQAGRATSGSAWTLLGEVYLTLKKYDSAIYAFNQVVNSGKYYLLSDYNALWNPSNKNNAESVFEVQFTGSVAALSSSYIYSFAPLFSGYATIGSFSPTSGAGRNIPTRDMINAYENGDKRKDASIAWFVDPNINPQYYESQHDSMPYIKKYAYPPSQPNQQNVDFYVYRYAQVLLWLAEAYNENGQTANAIPLINQIRERAGLPDILGSLSQDSVRTIVRHEERVESAFEDHRWFDLLRYGNAVQVMTQNGIEQKSYQLWLDPTAYTDVQNRLLFPIPLNETLLNHF